MTLSLWCIGHPKSLMIRNEIGKKTRAKGVYGKESTQHEWTPYRLSGVLRAKVGSFIIMKSLIIKMPTDLYTDQAYNYAQYHSPYYVHNSDQNRPAFNECKIC